MGSVFAGFVTHLKQREKIQMIISCISAQNLIRIAPRNLFEARELWK